MFYYRDKYDIIDIFEDYSYEVRTEYDAVAASVRLRGWPETEKFAGSWQVFGLYHDYRKMKSSCARVPTTEWLIEQVARACNTKVVMAGFSRMSPGTDILPHVDDVAIERRLHLGLKVPTGDCGFEVGGIQTKWEEGKAFVFDPRVVHRAWNKTSEDRVVLLVDFETLHR